MTNRGLQVVRIACAISLLTILVPFLWLDFREIRTYRNMVIFIPFVLASPVWLPYALALWYLRASRNFDPGPLKKGLATAVIWGGPALLAAGFALWKNSAECAPDIDVERFAGFIGATQIVLITGAIAAYRSMQRDSDDWRILAARLWIPLLGLPVLLLPAFLGPRVETPELSAVGTVRAIRMAQQEYAQSHPKEGFATSLEKLGPSPGAGLIDPAIASGKKYGYVFTLCPGPPEKDGLIRRYSLVAVSTKRPNCGTHSFFADETGLIRFTKENRAARPDDSLLE